ncbi:Coiled-coil domain-containing protein 81 [Collichthys lucidus]|uniref:Coiled-coil domain-containing protein 81 n=1 Tax=Collichthys lucidus TaxID=240159 RepID=A0A4U5U5X4_COLLU|nr:Coiled-coil domain-containing protein 81 [Collichthys lucidus]
MCVCVFAATHLPVVQLNYTAVSQETPFSRDVVEGCVRETLLLLFRALVSEQNVFLTLQGIGVLSFKNNKVRMKFNRDFIHAMDGTGRLLLAFNNRPGSSVSLLSGGLSRLHRPLTANPITLPTVCSPQTDNKAGDKDLCSLSPTPDRRNAGEIHQWRESKSNQTLQPAKMKPISLSEELDPKPPIEATDKPTTSIFPPDVAPKLEAPRVSVSCSGHTRAGQELCYLCMQRGQRNVPVYLREQQQAEEKAQEKLLLLKEQQRDKRHMDEEQTSFIFPARPLTPVRRIQQHRYMNELQSQIESRQQHEAQDQQNRLLMEHLDQVGDKKCPHPPECQADNSGFNRSIPDKFQCCHSKKKDELHSRQEQLEKEREILKHNKMEFISSRINRFEKRRDISKSLEDEWSRSAKLKHQREEEERRFLRSAGQLLVDKLAQYKRCSQCKRRTTNCGETNIWKDSHYLSGSQFMI